MEKNNLFDCYDLYNKKLPPNIWRTRYLQLVDGDYYDYFSEAELMDMHNLKEEDMTEDNYYKMLHSIMDICIDYIIEEYKKENE